MHRLAAAFLLTLCACAHGPATPPEAAGSRPPPLPYVEPPVPPRPGVLDGQRVGPLLRRGENQRALELMRKAYAAGLRVPDFDYDGACAAARLGLKDEAFTWMERAVNDGLRNPADFLEDD